MNNAKKQLLTELLYVFRDNPRALERLNQAAQEPPQKTTAPIQGAVKNTFWWAVEHIWWKLYTSDEEKQRLAVEYLRRKRYQLGDNYPPRILKSR